MMKMNDVFELPIHYDSGNDCLIECDGTPCGQLCTDTLQEHAAHAINCHDELVELVTACLEWIDSVPKDVELPAMPGFDRDWANSIMQKAK